jgi:hypothetical protein
VDERHQRLRGSAGDSPWNDQTRERQRWEGLLTFHTELRRETWPFRETSDREITLGLMDEWSTVTRAARATEHVAERIEQSFLAWLKRCFNQAASIEPGHMIDLKSEEKPDDL